jgi:hypothetical protein
VRRLWPVVALLLCAAAPARAQIATRVELYTMGSGDDVFEAFGHAALCIVSAAEDRGVCYNYGTADFSDPVALVWDVLRGRARFWVSRMALPLMLQAYTVDDRTIYRQKLDLPVAAAEALAARLEADSRQENKFYLYHHYRNNCSTRLRDHLDSVTRGRLSAGGERGYGASFRELTKGGFVESIWLLAGMEVLVGRRLDREASLWDAMFIPAVMRTEVARRFNAPPEVFYQRKGPSPTLGPHAGTRVMWATALILTLIMVAGAAAPGKRPFGAALVVTGLVVGLAGVLVDVTAIVASLPELRQNEVLLVLLPTDLALVFLRGRALHGYLMARLVLMVVVAGALAAGVLAQPMWPAIALAAGPMIVAAVRARG